MKVKKSENKVPLTISSRKKMARIAISLDGSTPMSMEFSPANVVPWLIGSFQFGVELEFQVFGARGGRIADSDLDVEWLTIVWPE